MSPEPRTFRTVRLKFSFSSKSKTPLLFYSAAGGHLPGRLLTENRLVFTARLGAG